MLSLIGLTVGSRLYAEIVPINMDNVAQLVRNAPNAGIIGDVINDTLETAKGTFIASLVSNANHGYIQESLGHPLFCV